MGQLVRGGRLLAGFLRKRPSHCIVQLSNRCNLSCGFCSFWENPAHPDDELSLDEFEVASAKLAEGGSMVVSIEGGEPLLRKDIVPIIAAFARFHHPIMFTNGWYVTEELTNALWRAGLSSIGVSIDYAAAEQHDKHRGATGTFEAALRAIDILRASARNGQRQVTVMTVVMDDNIDQMEDLLLLSQEKGVSHQVTLLSTEGGGRSQAQGMPAAGAGARLVELKEKYPHFIAFTGYLAGIDPFLEGSTDVQCRAGELFLNIDHLGNVSPCIEKLKLTVGNIRRDPWSILSQRLRALEETKVCTDCHTSCKGFVNEMSGAPTLRAYREFFGDFVHKPRRSTND